MMQATENSVQYLNPVWNGYLADPFVLQHDGWYYAYGTGSSSGDAVEDNGRTFPVLRSRNLAQWEPLGNALEVPPQFQGGAFWAPEVAFRNGQFWMYYSAAQGPSPGIDSGVDGTGDETHRLRVANASHPGGPFSDCGVMLLPEEEFTIDAHPFCDPQTGEWYLFFAKDFFDERVGTGIAVVALSEDMQHTSGPVQTVLRATGDWHIHARDRFIYGQTWDAWHTVEGPSVLFHQGLYYCLYSGGAWHGDEYGVSFGVAEHPLGPWRDEWSREGPQVLRGVPGRVHGPGHNSVVCGPDGQTLFVVYHAWDKERTARRMCIDPLVWEAHPEGDRPRCDGPSFETKTLPLAPSQS
jgi:GH43 family beta-xylosidase